MAINIKCDALFLCQFFYPEYNSSATLPWDTAKYLSEHGIKTAAMCGYPKEYNNAGKVPHTEDKDGVQIKRLRYLQLKRGKRISRLINYFSFTLSVLLHIGELKHSKCVIVYSNPPVLPLAAVLANILYGTKIIFVSYDVYPEVAFASGSLSPDSLITKAMGRINNALFKRASAIIALTEEMKSFLMERRQVISNDQIAVIPNWAHESSRIQTPETYRKFNFSPADFIVSYFGNMGICQDVETLLQAIEQLKDMDHIKFFIVGHGSKKDYVIEKTKHLKNVLIVDFLTGKDFEQAVSISSCGIVSLEKGLRGMCAPSKYYSYLQGGIPVITISEKESYLAQEVVQEGIGKAINIGDSIGLSQAIIELSRDKVTSDRMSQRAHSLYENRYSMSRCLDQYVELIEKTLES